MLLSLQEESERSGREIDTITAVRASANRLDVPNDVVTSKGLLEAKL